MYRMTVRLGDGDFETLRELAWEKRRVPADHARYVIEQYLARAKRRLESSSKSAAEEAAV
jgi:hypothetical protein